ncbi:MAG: SDR family NAD(P)-dependent oxidoreductase [Proteobacteria bacterium]|nr:SDR family NAD(P)-dependent oxidoreductase [Pseudomonadota bacterium]
MNRFADKVALVTGAAGGIGRACAVQLASEGARLCCVDYDAGGLEETMALLDDKDGRMFALTCDVRDEAQVVETIKRCVDHFGGLDVLVNMAGTLRFDMAVDLKLEDWANVLAINLTGTMLMCKHALPHLESSSGSIVNAASTAAHAGIPYGIAYAASKGGVLAMTRSIAMEYAKRGVRANTVSPGHIATGMTGNVTFPEEADIDFLFQRTQSILPPADPKGVASMVALLASEEAFHITGQDVLIDGGTLG